MILAAGCSTTKKINTDEKEKISALVMPKIDSMMQGYTGDDYQKFSADFSPKLREGMPLSGFNDTRKMLTEKIGNYQSFKIADIMETQNFIAVVCDAVFDNDGKVTIRVIFDPKDNYSISGLWFDSPELRK
jgi:hypothetical protein